MRRITFIATLICGILVVPLLCGAGITDHECICDSVECCPEGSTCEPDPCGDAYQASRQNHQPVAQMLLTFVTSATDVLPANEDPQAISVQGMFDNKPFPPSDLPLRI
jgi:hypothetical protein